jgi:predicted aconitase with swiveling domain
MSGAEAVERILRGKAVVPGRAQGTAVVSSQALSLWGGLNPHTGEIIDRRHDRSGAILTGKVFVFPTGKGSSTSSTILMESVRAGTAPAAIINVTPDPLAALGAIVADELYGRTVPIVTVSQADFDSIREGDELTVECDGSVRLQRSDRARDGIEE